MQVTNYGLGGLCEPHIGKNLKKIQKRAIFKLVDLFFRSYRMVRGKKDWTSV